MAHTQHGWIGQALLMGTTGAAVVVGLLGCGDSDQRQIVPAANTPGQPAHELPPSLRREVEVYVDRLPSRPYKVIALYRYPAWGNTGNDMPGLKEQVRRDGGDALLVRVVSGNLGRTDIDPQSLVEASIITWEQ